MKDPHTGKTHAGMGVMSSAAYTRAGIHQNTVAQPPTPVFAQQDGDVFTASGLPGQRQRIGVAPSASAARNAFMSPACPELGRMIPTPVTQPLQHGPSQPSAGPSSPRVGDKRTRDCLENARLLAHHSAELITTVEMLWKDNQAKDNTIARLQDTLKNVRAEKTRLARQHAILSNQLATRMENAIAAPACPQETTRATLDIEHVRRNIAGLAAAAKQLPPR